MLVDEINKTFGRKAIEIYNVCSPVYQLSRFIGKGLYQECSLDEAEEALIWAKNLGENFILGDPERVVMLVGWGYSENEKIEVE